MDKRILVIILCGLCFSQMTREVLAASSDGITSEFIPVSRNLGIGIKAPTAKLVVNGTTLIKGTLTIKDGTQAAGYVLKSDAAGNGSWVSTASLVGSSAWTDTGTLLHPTDLSGAQDVAIGDTTTGAADILLNANGSAIFNQQKYINGDLTISGDNITNLFFSDASTDRIGLNTASPAALLDIGGGTRTYINGTDDLLVADDAEVDGTVFATTFNGSFYGDGSQLTGITGLTPAGSDGYIQYYNGGALNANSKLYWSKTYSRLGLANLAPDTLIDINGATTYREIPTEPATPDEDTAVFWLTNGTGNGDDGDFMAKVKETGVTKVFTIIDFSADQNNPRYESVTLNGLTASRLVKTDANKTLASVSEIIIDGAGNVGIGTANPSSKLDVSGKLTTQSFKMTSGATPDYLLRSDATGNASWIDSATIVSDSAAGNNTEVQFNNAGSFDASSDLTWDGTRLYALGFSAAAGAVATPSYSFAGDANTGLYQPAADNIGFVVGGTEAMRVNSSGQLGIGKTNPSATADINGTLAMKTSSIQTLSAGSILSASNSIMKVAGSGGAVDLTSNPQVSLTSIADGQLLIIKGTSNINTVRFDDGTGLSLKDGAYVILGNKDTLVLIYDAGDNEWLEVMRSDK